MNISKPRAKRFEAEEQHPEADPLMANNKNGCKRCNAMTEDDLKLEKDAKNYKHRQNILEFYVACAKAGFLTFMMIAAIVHVCRYGFSTGAPSPAPQALALPAACKILEEAHQLDNIRKESDVSTIMEQFQSLSGMSVGAMKQEETPVEQEEAPVKQEEVPVKQEEAPVKQEEAPVKQEEAPVKQEEAPVKQEEAPVKQEETPVKQEEMGPEETSVKKVAKRITGR